MIFLFPSYSVRFEKLSEDIPVGVLAEKYMRMINTFSMEMERITKFFRKQINKPPIPRNFPDSSGKFKLLYGMARVWMGVFSVQDTTKPGRLSALLLL